MTLPAAGSAMSFSQIQAEFGGSNPISLSEYYASASEYGTPVSSDRYGKPVAGANWVVIPSSASIRIGNFFSSTALSASHTVGFASNTIQTYGQYTTPGSASRAIRVVAMGAGGGGGGGSSRYYAWWPHGGGGGGGSGELRYASMVVDPDTVVNCFVGAGGSLGGARDGPYSAGSSGGAGGYSGVLNAAQTAWYVLSYGGQGGLVSGNYTNAAGGEGGIGTLWIPGLSGGAPTYSFTAGGKGQGDIVYQYGGVGAPGQMIEYPKAGQARRVVWQTTSAAHDAGRGSFNYPSNQAAGVTAPSNASYDCGGGGGGGGVNVADNNGGMTGGAGGNGYCLICW